MTRFYAALSAVLVASTLSAAAATMNVAPHGNDEGDCFKTPCRTLKWACDIVSRSAGRWNIRLAPGSYAGGCNIAHFAFVVVSGNCRDNTAVIIQLTGRDLGFWVQDHATLMVNCLTIQSSGEGSSAIQTRQYAIADYENIRFGEMRGGAHVHVNEASRANCQKNAEIFGNAGAHVTISAQSYAILNCKISIVGVPAFDAFVAATLLSIIDASLARIEGSITGLQFISNTSIVLQPTGGSQARAMPRPTILLRSRPSRNSIKAGQARPTTGR